MSWCLFVEIDLQTVIMPFGTVHLNIFTNNKKKKISVLAPAGTNEFLISDLLCFYNVVVFLFLRKQFFGYLIESLRIFT